MLGILTEFYFSSHYFLKIKNKNPLREAHSIRQIDVGVKLNDAKNREQKSYTRQAPSSCKTDRLL